MKQHEFQYIAPWDKSACGFEMAGDYCRLPASDDIHFPAPSTASQRAEEGQQGCANHCGHDLCEMRDGLCDVCGHCCEPSTSVVEATPKLPRRETDWYVDRRPLDVLLPHVPGFEVVSDEDAEWKAIARSKEIGEQISAAVNNFAVMKEALEGLLKLIESGDLVRDVTNDDEYSVFVQQGLRIARALAVARAALAALKQEGEQRNSGD